MALDLNTATFEELKREVGQDGRAHALSDGRTAHGGPFRDWEEVKAACGFDDEVIYELQQMGLTLDGADDGSPDGGPAKRHRSQTRR